MKNFTNYVMLGIVALVTLAAMGAGVLQTQKHGYNLVRSTVDGDVGSTVDLTSAGRWDLRPSETWKVPTKSDGSIEANALSFTFAAGIDAGTTANNKTLSWKLYAWKDLDAPAEYVALGTATFGTQDVGRFPDRTFHDTGDLRNWADTIAITTQYFPKTLAVTTIANDSICKLTVDGAGYGYWYFEITDANGTGSEAGDVSVWATWF